MKERRSSLALMHFPCDVIVDASEEVTNFADRFPWIPIILEDVAVLGECCPAGRDPSLNLLILTFVCDAASLLQVDVAFNFVNLSGVDIY